MDSSSSSAIQAGGEPQAPKPARDSAAPGRATGDKRSGRKRKDMGRSRNEGPSGWRRERNEESKRRKLERDDYKPAIYSTEFSKDEIAAEERKPKRKVAVMIGYSGSGYHGMQINHTSRTIEGDLFQAFVKAGAVSKANADDPKKISFARCARTDKGVHAAGNVISLKLIIEDPDIVDKINGHLSPQIRVWGLERTSNSFSAYNLCDSRIYEYLIPTHCFLPPHPRSFLGRKLHDLAEEAGDSVGYQQRQADVADFWASAERDHLAPILEKVDPELREAAYRQVFEGADSETAADSHDDSASEKSPVASNLDAQPPSVTDDGCNTEDREVVESTDQLPEEKTKSKSLSPIEQVMRNIKVGIIEAKKGWRISPERIRRVQEALSQYVGVHNYHNYTVRKQFSDPSAKRVIKSFIVDETPILINGTEWLSLKVHGQAFMMHQIRKMVGMAALVVRCGSNFDLMRKSMGPERVSIPRAPGLGLLLERPIFDSYNKKLHSQPGAPDRNSVAFDKYKTAMDEFKQREIYARLYREEEASNVFHQLFWAVDNLRTTQFLYLSSKGLAAVDRGSKDALNGQNAEMADIDESSSEGDEGEDG